MPEFSKLTIDQLLDVDWYKNHQGVPQQIVKHAFNNCIANPNVRILRKGNTVLVVDTVRKDFHFINAEGFQDFIKNVKELLHACGEKEIHTDFSNPLIIEVAKHAGVEFEIQETNHGYLMNVRL